VLPDADDKKWEEYPPHTKAKHAILIRYMGAWLNILAGGARAAGYPADLVIVDAFAGRGRYSTDDLGSPLLLRAIAGDVLANKRRKCFSTGGHINRSPSRTAAHGSAAGVLRVGCPDCG
jgi:hypothetical protein